MKDSKRKTTRPRKRVIAILLSVLMVLSIVLPSGGSGVRYNAYAEGEESAIGEGVELATGEDALPEENTDGVTEEITEASTEEITDSSAEETTEGLPLEAGDVLGDDIELLGIENESLLGDGEYVNPKLIEIAANHIEVSLSNPSQTINRDSSFEIKIDYTIPQENLTEAKRQNSENKIIWVYDMSTFLADNPQLASLSDGATGDIQQGSTKRGRYTVSENKVYLDITDTVWLLGQTGDVQGTFELAMQLDADNIGSENSLDFSFPGTNDDFTLEFTNESKADINKSVTGENNNKVKVTPKSNGTYDITYTLEVKPNSNHKESFKVVDTLSSSDQSFVTGSFELKPGWNGNTAIDLSSYVTLSDSDKTATIDIWSAMNDYKDSYSTYTSNGNIIKANTSYFITYTTNVTAAGLGTELTNSVNCIWESNGTNENPTTKSVNLYRKVETDKSYAAVSGQENTYKYTITIGDADTDLSNLTIKDTMKDLQYISGDITLTKSDSSTVTITPTDGRFSDTSYSDNTYELFDYNTDAGFGVGPIIIEYTVVIPNNEDATNIVGEKSVTNKVDVTGTSIEESDDTSFSHRFNEAVDVEKELTSFDEDNKKFTWKITVSNPSTIALQDVYVSDKAYGNRDSETSGGTEDTIDWDNIEILDSSDNPIDASLYTVGETGPESIGKCIHFTEIPANTSYIINVTTETSELVNGKYYTNTACAFYDNYYYRADESTASKRYSTNTFDMNKSYTYNDATGIYTWTVVVNSEKNIYEPDSKLYFVDELPSGMEYVDGSFSVKFDGKITKNDVSNSDENWKTYKITPSITNNIIGPIDVSSAISNENNYNTSDTYIVGINELKSTFTYQTKLTDEELEAVKGSRETRNYTNTAKITDSTGGNVKESATSTATYDYKFLTKTDMSDTNLAKDKIRFEIVINPDELTINEGDTLTLTDTLATNIELLFGGDDALTVTDKNGADMIADGRAKVSYNDDTRKITIIVPDSTKAIVNYSVRTRQTGNITVSNEAILVGGNKSYSDSTSEQHNVSSHSATIQGGGIQLHKIDENNLELELTGAEFSLYEVPFDSTTYIMGTPTAVLENITSATNDNYYDLPATSLQPGKLYYWIETKAPTDYILEASPHYFTVYEKNNDDSVTTANYNAAKLIDNGVQDHNTGVIVNTVELGSYVWNVCNKKGTSIQITKDIDSESDPVPAAITGYTINVKFSNGGTYTVAHGSETGTNEVFESDTPKELTIAAGETITISGIPEGTTYTVTEDLSDATYAGFSTPVYTYSDPVYKMTGTDVDTVTITNKYTSTSTPIPAAIIFTKVSADDSNTKIPNAVFGIYDDENCTNEVAEVTTTVGGIATYSIPNVNDLLSGTQTSITYYIKEKSVPASFKPNTTTIYPVTIDVTSGTAEVTYGTGNDNSLTITNDEAKVTLKIKKVDSANNSGLEGAGFTLYSDSSCTTPVGVEQITSSGNDYTVAFTGLSPETDYWYKETTIPTDYNAVTTDAVKVTTTSVNNADVVMDTIIVGNTRKKGNLTLKKLFENPSTINYPSNYMDETFKVKVTLKDENNVLLSGEKTFDTEYNSTAGTVTFTNGVSSVIEITGTNMFTIKDLPYGYSYTIEEQDLTDAQTTAGYSIKNGTNNGTIDADSQTVTVTNTFNHETGSILIHKSVTGDRSWSEVKGYISFTVEGPGSYSETITGNQAGWEGTGNDVTYTLSGLELGTYTVTETVNDIIDTNASNYTRVTKAAATVNPTEVVNSVTNIELSSTAKDKNAYFVNDYTKKTGGFTVTKELTGTNADATKEFPIVVTLTYPSVDDIAGSYSVDGGTSTAISGTSTTVDITVKLAKDKSAVFTGIPYGTTFEVSETISDADAAEGYTKTSIIPSESMTMDDTKNDTSIKVTNNYDQGKGSIVIYKTLAGDDNINWDNVKGNISFKISDGNTANDKTVLGTADGWEYNETTKVATYTYTELELGTYSVTEVLNTTTGTIATNYDVTTKAGAAENPTTIGEVVSGIELSTSNRSGKAYFTNEYTRKTGSFTVEKIGTFEGDATEFETGKEFSITVSFTFPSGVTPAGSYKIGSGSSTAINVNSVTFNLKKEEKATFTGIPYGTTYTVSEADLSTEMLDAGYLKDSIVYGNDDSLNKGTITDTTANTNVVVKNKRVLPVKGYIEITKTVSGDRNWNDIKEYISFSITSDGFTKTIQGTDAEWSVTGNVATYQLTGLDLDKIYKVEEIINGDTKASYYRLTQTAGKSDTGLATGKEVSDIALSSTSKSGKAYFENNYTRLTGSLKLVKAFDTSVTDYPTDYMDVGFKVQVTLKDENNALLTGTKEYSGVTFTNGVSDEIIIKGNQVKTIEGIPYGYSFAVRELNPTVAGYSILAEHGTASGTIDATTPDPTATVTNTYSPTTGSLRIIKSFGTDSALIAGDITSGQITFDVSGTSATNYHKVYDFKDNFINGELTILSLEPDTYTVTERSTISDSDYTKITTVKIGSGADNVSDNIVAQVSAGTVTEVTFTNTYTRVENAKLKITKEVNGLPDSIKADKEFKLVIEYLETGSTISKYVAKDATSTSGYSIVTTEPAGDAVPTVKAGTPLVITNLPYGTYNVTEKTDSASIDVDYYTFKLSDSTVSGSQVFDSNVEKEVALTNTYEENRTVGFNKFDLTSGTALPLNGASFELYKGADLISRVVPSNGTFYVNGLKANVTYTLREVSAPDGYTTVKDITFVIDEDNKVTVTPGKAGEATATGDIINVCDKKTSVKISKVDITNEKELPGATIQILDKDGNVVTDENGDKLEWTSTSTPKEIVGLKTGVTYTLRETVAPDGYQLTTDTVFKLNKDGSLDGTATTTTVSNEGVLLVEDAPLGAFAVNKKGYYNELCSDGANATIPLEGVKFTLTKKDDAAYGQTKETDKDGIAAFTGLQPGTYELKETQTIEGYILDESVYTIKINADGSNDGLKDASGKAVEGNIITNDVPRTNLQLVKVNLSNKNVKLPGSTYGLFRKSLGIGTDTGKGTNEDGQLVKIAESVTDKDGILSFKGVLTGVDYTVQELAAPNGFYVSEQPITISFKTDEKGNVVIDKVSDGKGTIVLSATGEITWLEPQIKVSFTKQDMNGKNLAGAKLKVVDSNGNDVISWTSTTEAYVVEGTFTAGESYKLVEVEAPEGYEIAEPVEFTIAEKAGANGSDVISVIMKDKEKTTTTVTPPEKTTPPSVKTGDSAPVKPVTAMMFISLAGIVFLLILGRRRKELFK